MKSLMLKYILISRYCDDLPQPEGEDGESFGGTLGRTFPLSASVLFLQFC